MIGSKMIRSKTPSNPRLSSPVLAGLICLLLIAPWISLSLSLPLLAQDSAMAPRLNFDFSKATPRAVEDLTQHSIARDYKIAWANLAQAMESNAADALGNSFSGTAAEWLLGTVHSQKRNGMTSRYLNQDHKLEAVFYAPEGDVIELHDTASYQLQLLDGGKVIHDEHVVARYVVMMTPGADHWVVRQLQAVSQF